MTIRNSQFAIRDMVRWGKLLFERRLISGWGGNLSCRLGKDRFLITGQHAPLGFLTARDLVEIDRTGRPVKKTQQASSETRVHLAVYNGTEARAIIHAHPPMVLSFSLAHSSFIPLSFEEKYTLGEVPVVPQETPTVTDTESVVKELRLRPVVILRGHGTVAVGKDLREAFLLTDLLEEAVRCQYFQNLKPNSHGPSAEPPPKPKTEKAAGPNAAYALFSREHIRALVESANSDPQFQSAGRESGLTTSLTLHLEDTDTPWTVHFDEGRITRSERGGEGEFVISGKREWWEAIFQRRIDPFLATQQGKLRLKRGELWQLSRWFKPFQRAFALWQSIPVK
ncbi:MAG: class II aldolase/adducin family protein [Deltaproteobacteria bacterium]|nr:class II aldolase/adducin family protein [Deltaproteobacteria bacterium]